MKSITHGDVSVRQVADIIAKAVQNKPNNTFKVIIGTDSQNTDRTKVVTVIALWDVGHGGQFFYDIERIKPIRSLQEKIMYETTVSLKYIDELISCFDAIFDETGFDYTTIEVSIHVDAGMEGPTRKYITAISGWITSLGYKCSFKPEASIASTVADRISK